VNRPERARPPDTASPDPLSGVATFARPAGRLDGEAPTAGHGPVRRAPPHGPRSAADPQGKLKPDRDGPIGELDAAAVRPRGKRLGDILRQLAGERQRVRDVHLAHVHNRPPPPGGTDPLVPQVRRACGRAPCRVRVGGGGATTGGRVPDLPPIVGDERPRDDSVNVRVPAGLKVPRNLGLLDLPLNPSPPSARPGQPTDREPEIPRGGLQRRARRERERDEAETVPHPRRTTALHGDRENASHLNRRPPSLFPPAHEAETDPAPRRDTSDRPARLAESHRRWVVRVEARDMGGRRVGKPRESPQFGVGAEERDFLIRQQERRFRARRASRAMRRRGRPHVFGERDGPRILRVGGRRATPERGRERGPTESGGGHGHGPPSAA